MKEKNYVDEAVEILRQIAFELFPDEESDDATPESSDCDICPGCCICEEECPLSGVGVCLNHGFRGKELKKQEEQKSLEAQAEISPLREMLRIMLGISDNAAVSMDGEITIHFSDRSNG